MQQCQQRSRPQQAHQKSSQKDMKAIRQQQQHWVPPCIQIPRSLHWMMIQALTVSALLRRRTAGLCNLAMAFKRHPQVLVLSLVDMTVGVMSR